MDIETAANLYEEEAAECLSILKHYEEYTEVHNLPKEFIEELAAEHLHSANLCRGFNR